MSDNPYLSLRASKIARNEERLRQLGLLKKTQQKQADPTERRERIIKKKRKSEPPTRLQPTRRSQRTSKANVENKVSAQELVAERENMPRKKPSVTKEIERAPAAPNSVRRMIISVPEIVNKFLGKTLSNTGKAFVIQSVLESDDSNISFNKYSGILEWQNDALFLWVNIASDSMNDFLKAGQQMTWFGGSRMHEESPVIQKLFRIVKESENSNGNGNGIVLWCRHYNPKTKTHHPYTCLGRLSYDSHIPQSQPLQFIWNLDDYSALMKHHKQRFQEIVTST